MEWESKIGKIKNQRSKYNDLLARVAKLGVPVNTVTIMSRQVASKLYFADFNNWAAMDWILR